jgi:hypothetical protein
MFVAVLPTLIMILDLGPKPNFENVTLMKVLFKLEMEYRPQTITSTSCLISNYPPKTYYSLDVCNDSDGTSSCQMLLIYPSSKSLLSPAIWLSTSSFWSSLTHLSHTPSYNRNVL